MRIGMVCWRTDSRIASTSMRLATCSQLTANPKPLEPRKLFVML